MQGFNFTSPQTTRSTQLSTLTQCIRLALGVAVTAAVSFPLAAAANSLSCGPVYATSYSVSGTGSLVLSPKLYQLNGNAATLAGTASTTLGPIAQATDTNMYFFNATDYVVRKFTGTATSAFATTWPNSATGSGEGGANDGFVYYVGGNYHLYSMTPATGVVTDLGALVAKSGDTIYNTLVAGDVAADNNGRLYWYASVPDASGNLGQGTSYLYRIDKNTLQTTNLGQYGPNGATGAAFDSNGKLITTAGYPASSVFSIDLGTSVSTNLGTATGLGSNPGVFDIASCTFPTLDPAFINSTETAANITTGQTPASLVMPNNTVEYTITAANSGNLASDTTTFADSIPAGTTYVAGSTTLNGVAVADVGGKMPFDPTSTAKREIHTAGQAAGVILPGASNAAIIKFRVIANASGLPTTVDNQAAVNYPTVANGTTTFTDAKTNLVQIPTDTAPVITSNSGGATASINVNTGGTAVTTVTTTDVDAGDTQTYSISGGTNAALFQIDPATGVLSFKSASITGTYQVIVQVADSKGLIDTQTLTVIADKDTDGDGIPDSLDDDVDGDGIPNIGECKYGPAQNGLPISITNEGFELPKQPSGVSFPMNGQVPGWITSATDNYFEFWADGALGVPAYEGRQFVELNAYQVSTLYQKIATKPGDVLQWSFAHRGRQGVDTLALFIGAPGAALDASTQQGTYSTGNTAWKVYTGTYTVPAGQTVTQFAYKSVSAAGGNPAIGNFLDAISFSLLPPCGAADMDGDGIPNMDDLDSDNDGIPDNVEAQTTAGYKPPSGTVDANGIDTAYGAGLVPVDTDGDLTPDFVDTDTDNAQTNDTTEAGLTLAGKDSDGDGLDDTVDTDNAKFGPANAGITNVLAAYPNNATEVGWRTSTILNNPPTITSDGGGATASLSKPENQTAVTTVTATDSDVGDTLTYSITGGADAALFSLDPATGVLTFKAAPNFENPMDAGKNNVYDVQVSVADSKGGTDVQDIAVTITNVNEAPTALDDSATTLEDTTLNGSTVLINDTDVDGNTLSVNTTPIVAPTHGTLVLKADGTYTYTPTANYNGTDSFTYEVSDGNGGKATAVVKITISPVNDAPVANADTANTPEDTVLNGSTVLSNDTDVDGDTLSVNTTPVVAPTHGTLTLKADGTYTYTPNQNFNGTDSFTYEVSDGHGSTSTATVALTITPVNDPPVAMNDTATTREGTTLNGTTLLANDTDVDGDTLRVDTTPVVAPAHGTLTLQADGTYTYTPTLGFNGTDSFTYKVSDGKGGSTTASVTITIAKNNAPIANADSVTIAEDSVLNGTTVLANDTDPDGDTLSVNTTPVVAPAHGTLALKADGTYTYTANANYNGTDSFTYEVSDGKGGMNTAVVTLTVTPINDPPKAMDDTASTPEDTVLNGSTVLSNDTDVDGDTLSVNTTPVVAPTHGTLTLKANGTYTYSPAKDFNGTDSFTYEVSDGNGGKTTAVVNLTISPVNDAPVITSTNNVTFAENGTGTALDVQSTDDSDAESSGLTYSLQPMFDAAVFNIDPATGAISFKAPPDYEAPKDSNGDNAYLLMTQVCDSSNLCTEQVEVIVVTNVQETSPPVITATSMKVPENQTFVTTVSAADPDVGNVLTFSIKGGADAALFSIDPSTGVLSFKTAPDFEKPNDANTDNVYELIVSVWDGTAVNNTAEQALKVTVTDVQENTAPTITSNGAGDTATLSIPEEQLATTTVQATDAEGDTLTYSISGGNDAALFQIDPSTGKLTFITAPDFENPTDTNNDNQYQVAVTVKDKAGASDTQALTITVTDVADVKLQVRGFLQGAYVSKDGLMRDNLRSLGLIPNVQPYGATGMPFAYTGTESAFPAPLAASGNDAPVDWVLVELRDATTPKTRVNAMAGLLQRDGDVVDAKTGSKSLIMEHIPAGQYYVTLRHRNHLAVTTATPITLSSNPTAVDFTQTTTATLGKDARLVSGNIALLWAGDANMSDKIIATGPSNDSNVVLGSILTHPDNSLSNTNFRLGGYTVTDLNLDGISIYSGPSNDINLLLGNVLLHPGNSTFAANYILNGSLPK